MFLDARLKKVVDLISTENKVADIGADHGYLSMALLDKGIKKVQVIENKIGPLNNAKKNLMNYQNVSFSLSSGLTDLDADINLCTICGMGGLTIIDIITESIDKCDNLELILQPNDHVDSLRMFLSNNLFEITDEYLVFEKNHYYNIIITKKTNKIIHLTDDEILFGPMLLKKQPISIAKSITSIVVSKHTMHFFTSSLKDPNCKPIFP